MKLLTLTEAAELLGLSRVTINKLCLAGEIAFVQIRSRKKILLSEIERYIYEHTVTNNPFNTIFERGKNGKTDSENIKYLESVYGK